MFPPLLKLKLFPKHTSNRDCSSFFDGRGGTFIKGVVWGIYYIKAYVDGGLLW